MGDAMIEFMVREPNRMLRQAIRADQVVRLMDASTDDEDACVVFFANGGSMTVADSYDDLIGLFGGSTMTPSAKQAVEDRARVTKDREAAAADQARVALAQEQAASEAAKAAAAEQEQAARTAEREAARATAVAEDSPRRARVAAPTTDAPTSLPGAHN